MQSVSKELTVRQLYENKQRDFELEILCGHDGLGNTITTPDVNRPGLAFAGYTDYFLWERVQIVGRTEVSYLATLDADRRRTAIERVLDHSLPCVIVAKRLDVPEDLTAGCRERAIPLLRTPISTTPFIHLLTSYLEIELAPEVVVHGTLVDVYGVGLLFMGKSGIGKSECALDLVERGHRLVADDLVRITRRGRGLLIGAGYERARTLQHFMEIRGIGIIDVGSIFGIRATRLQKRVEVQVTLVEWSDKLDYERIGLEDQVTEILGVAIPVVHIPLFPGKNITVISEVVAMNYLLKIRGYHPAKEFDKRLVAMMGGDLDYHSEEDME
ncbi:hypothetical protein AMJ39_02415 [candidate division TA06 bacterium DG_24]|uniref:HPr kinase/phosphorylase n=3 Tax=Bacteria division TA06 TaxID=1156500 RepID=A0A0S8JJY3_UNCT6|nr:MAG: hypothetical protein AMJ39_02415 [candidate division TA06 bacterium DG_24]KPK69907.1 MAG: hypothetical protein AMJ82_04420 [candidate division TA06 bacterium SM23_40]KPL10105.1 MAG: hypothetical protein AMJ71_04425 [candidate division TA06 bacterium SM1_40]